MIIFNYFEVETAHRFVRTTEPPSTSRWDAHFELHLPSAFGAISGPGWQESGGSTASAPSIERVNPKGCSTCYVSHHNRGLPIGPGIVSGPERTFVPGAAQQPPSPSPWAFFSNSAGAFLKVPPPVRWCAGLFSDTPPSPAGTGGQPAQERLYSLQCH